MSLTFTPRRPLERGDLLVRPGWPIRHLYTDHSATVVTKLHFRCKIHENL